MGLVRQNQAENFKKNYISEMKFVINYLEGLIKKGENLTDEDAQESKAIICENIDKFKDLR